MPPYLKRRKIDDPTNERIPRPANCFMIFRADWLRKSVAKSTPGNHNRQRQKDVSLEAAAAWRSLSPDLKQLYKIQADIIKEEHGRKYPGWIYKPRAAKRKKKVRDDTPQDGPPTKRVARGHTAPYQKPSVDLKRERKAEATPFNPITAPAQFFWDSSWFSRSSLMKDPFYSTPIQPIVSVSPSSRTHDIKVAHLTKESPANPPPVVPAYPHFPPPAQMHGFDVPNLQAMPSMYSFQYPVELHNYNTLNPTSNALGFSAFQSSSQATTQAEPPVDPNPPILSSSSTGYSTPAAGSSVSGVVTPEPNSEAEPPSQALVNSSDITFDKLLESYCYSNDWEPDPEFDPNFTSFSMMGY